MSTVSSARKMPSNHMQLLNPQSIVKFSKKISELPLSVDIPRLFPLTSILDKNGNKIWDNRSAPRVSHLQDFLILIAQYLNQPKNEDDVRNRFYEFVPQNVEVSHSHVPNGLKGFFNFLGEENGLIGILKCINQDIIVPAVTVLKFAFFTSLINYFEIRGKWDVIIKFNENNITVTNKRWERSSPEAFNFCWDVSFILNTEATKLIDTKLEISKIDFITEISEEQREIYMEVMRPFYNPT